jgi:regulator of sirC expression with transglutaminase-like and TPR domain
MQENKEIQALFKLIEDPDAEVFENVSNKIISFGKTIIPNLEHFEESITDEVTLQKVASIIRKLNLASLNDEIERWKQGNQSLLEGSLLLTSYLYPSDDTAIFYKEIEKLRRNIWLELNSYLTPLEQANVMSGILFSYFQLKGKELQYSDKDMFVASKVAENKQGNAFGNATLMLILAQLLDIPLQVIHIPNQFIIGYFDISFQQNEKNSAASQQIKFFIDPLNGQLYTHLDVENYLKKMGLQPENKYYTPYSNNQVIAKLFKEVAKCYEANSPVYEEIKAIIESLQQ